MGTRADFYVGRGKKAEWLGSIAWDGYPDGLTTFGIVEATTEKDYRAAVAALLEKRDDGTKPEQGWPWPWTDSHTTDYSYAFDGDAVYATRYGYKWFKATDPEPEHTSKKETVFPNMKSRQKVTLGSRSGLMILGPRE
jgi:hypothetical protein